MIKDQAADCLVIKSKEGKADAWAVVVDSFHLNIDEEVHAGLHVRSNVNIAHKVCNVYTREIFMYGKV